MHGLTISELLLAPCLQKYTFLSNILLLNEAEFKTRNVPGNFNTGDLLPDETERRVAPIELDDDANVFNVEVGYL